MQATDMQRVFFESFTAPSVQTRLTEMKNLPSPSSSRSHNRTCKSLADSEGDELDPRARADGVLKKIRDMMEVDWASVELELRDHDFYVGSNCEPESGSRLTKLKLE